MTPWSSWALLGVAIVSEVAGTTMLKFSDGFTRWQWSLGTVAAYGLSLWLLAIVLRTLPVGIAYAIWAGLGIVLVALIGVIAFRQRLDAAALLGIGLILAGVLVLNLLSKTTPH